MATSTPSTTEFSQAIFGVEVSNHELLKLAYDSYLAAARTSATRTKTRGMISGGGKKPWKQKGTGRARFGSSRNPIWRGGGIVFGPTGAENYHKRLSTTQKRVALRQALTLARKADKIVVLEPNFSGKTKDAVEFLNQNNLNAIRRVLLVADAKTPELIRSTRNIQSIELLSAMYLSVFHILNADKIVISPAALQTVETWLSKDSAQVTAASVSAARANSTEVSSTEVSSKEVNSKEVNSEGEKTS